MESEPIDVAGLRGARLSSLRRVPLRTRDSAVTRSGWRLELSCAQGAAAIVLAEQGAASFYRGEGILLGWPQEKMAEVYGALTSTASADDQGSGPQLG